jgi:hypothetical protein
MTQTYSAKISDSNRPTTAVLRDTHMHMLPSYRLTVTGSTSSSSSSAAVHACSISICCSSCSTNTNTKQQQQQHIHKHQQRHAPAVSPTAAPAAPPHAVLQQATWPGCAQQQQAAQQPARNAQQQQAAAAASSSSKQQQQAAGNGLPVGLIARMIWFHQVPPSSAARSPADSVNHAHSRTVSHSLNNPQKHAKPHSLITKALLQLIPLHLLHYCRLHTITSAAAQHPPFTKPTPSLNPSAPAPPLLPGP